MNKIKTYLYRKFESHSSRAGTGIFPHFKLNLTTPTHCTVHGGRTLNAMQNTEPPYMYSILIQWDRIQLKTGPRFSFNYEFMTSKFEEL